MPLTKSAIDRLVFDPSGAKLQMHYDHAGVPGFGVIVSKSGVKSFVVQYRPNGTGAPRRFTLGRYGVLTLDQARNLAKDVLHSARKGDDPSETRRNKRLEQKRAVTLRDFVPIYIENARTAGNPARKRRPKKTWREDQRRLEKYVVPKLGMRRLTDISKADVTRLHSAITARYEANRVLALASVFFEAARMLGYLDDTAPNPCKGVQQFEEKSRERFVSEAEMPALLEAVNAETNVHIRAAFVLYLLTGLRRGELLALRWADVDLQRRVIRLHDTKAGRPHEVPLALPAVALLTGLPQLLGNPFVIASPRAAGQAWHGHAVKQAWNRVRIRGGLEDVRLHDLRRTVGSWLAMSGASLPLIGKVLNHSNASTTTVYARFQDDATRAALEQHAEAIVALQQGGKTS